MKKASVLLVGLFSTFAVQAADVPKELYMKLDYGIGGYLTLTLEPCEVQKISNPYVYKAKIETKLGTRRACWNTHVVTPEMEGKITPMVHVVEEDVLDDDTRLYYIHTIARYYFKDKKE